MPDRTRNRSARGSKSGARRGGSSRSSTKNYGAPKPKKATDAKPLTPTLDPPDIESFTEFELGDEIQQAIADMGITKPTPIQALAIEPVLKGKDVIAKAETGTGKTLAFGAPMMAKIDPARASVLGLVMSPTRELAEQVHQVLEKLGEARGVKTALIVGGEPLGPQVKKLQAGAQVVVGTPGRVLDLLNQKFLQFPWTEFAILDEADKMLEIGFIDDIKKILDACNEYRQTLLFSATFPPELLNLARGYTSDPAEIATASGVATVDTINQYVFRCSTDDNAKNIAHLIEDSAPEDVFLVFCERRTDVDMLMRKLERKRFSVKALHGGYDQAARFRVMTAFRTGDVKALVATDVASRGLDVAHVTHVVNLGLPREFSDYTHRIGRTGRAGRHGAAVTFISGRNERDFQSLLKHTGFDIAEIDRPRDLYVQERKRAAERNGEVIDVEPKKRERKPRKRDDEAEAREERPRRERKPRRSREERPEREERSERSSSRRPRRDEAAEDAPRAERKPRRERTARPKAEETDAPTRPRRERRPRREEESEANTAEAPERESRPRRARGERTRRPSSRDVEAAPPLEERPTRKRRPRRPDAADEGVAGPFAEEVPISEAPARRPRRPRRSAEERNAPAEEAASEDRPRRRPRRSAETRQDADEAPKRAPRRSRARAQDDAREEADAPTRTRSRRPAEDSAPDEAPERSRGGRRPRRSARSSEDEAPRPRRSRRDSEEGTQRESEGKAKTARPKRERVGETTRADSDPKPTRPTPGGGFGAGV